MGAAAVISLLVAFIAGGEWEMWLYFLNATPFGRVDPVLGRDIGFYFFTLPLLEGVHRLLLGLTLVATVATIIVYVLGEEVGLEPARGLFVSRRATRHLAVLAALLFLVLGFGAWLQIPQLLTGAAGNVTGATYSDVHARIPASWVLVVAAVLSAALALWQAFTTGRLWPIAAAAGLYVVVSAGGGAYAAGIQRFVVAPNEQVRETAFIEHNIQATRAAYRPRRRVRAAADRRRAPDARRPRSQRGNDRQRAALERPAAARHVRADPGDPHVLRLRRRRQRPLHDRRAIPADHAVGARAELGEPAEPHLDQRAPDVHPWLRADPRTGERGDRGGIARALHQGSAAGLDGRSEGDAAGDLLRRAAERTRLRQDEDRGIRLPARRGQRLHGIHRQRRRTALERVPAADVRDPLPLHRHVLLAEPDRGKPRHDVPADRGARRSASRRSSATIPIRISPSPTAAWSGCRTPTRHRAAIRTRRPPIAKASTTSATRSRSRSTPTTARPPTTSSIRRIRWRARLGRSSPAC